MAQFNASKNPPWVRSDNFPVPQMTQPAIHQQMLAPQMSPVVQYQQGPGQQQTATVYQAQLAMQQQALTMQQNLQQMANAQIYTPQINAVATAVGTRNLNAAAFAQPVVASPTTQPAPQQVTNIAPATTGTKQRVFTGIVTKVLDTYGFVDEDVFFQLSVVKGAPPVVNDRVLVEAVCLPNMPFKWNATRIQVLPMNDAPRSNKKGFIVSPTSSVDRGNYGTGTSLGDYDESRRDRDRDRDRRRRRSRERNRNRSPLTVHDEERRRKERRDRDDKDKEKDKDRERDRARSRSVKKSTLRQQAAKKYRVRVPEYPLDMSHLSVSDLRTRYHTMYVPSDFFRTSLKWQETFPPHQMEFSKNVLFHVVSKEVDRISDFPDDLEPPDADYLFCAKVMLLSVPSKDQMMKKCMQLSEDLDKDDGKNLVHPSRLINCLVGVNTRTKNEIMAIGGPWSPSLDGADPAGDVNVLIKTAIRTCRALTGIDLSPCTHWYRFVEIYYHRPKSTHKGKQIPARVETVVVYVPDVWSVMPSCLEWDELQCSMKKQMDSKLSVETDRDQAEVAADDEKVECVTSCQKEPTHYSRLDPKVMKVSELRDELEARNMSSKGLRLQLLARLSKILKTEQELAEQEEKNAAKVSVEKEKEKEEEEKKLKLEKEKKKTEQKNRALIEERYALPETPHILVYPSKTAKNGKFSCKVMSLSLLLDYSTDVSKEHTFEVSLFAELFNEMLMWHFGIQVYRAILEAPDVEEKDDSEKKDEKKEKEKKQEKGKDERDDKSVEREKSGEPSDEKKVEKTEPQNLPNGNGREGSQDSSEDDDDDSLSRDSSSNRRDRRDRKRKDSIAQYTAYPELLLAFTYFDVTRYGSISKSHLEDLIHTLGLQLSRSQVKRLVGKVTYRDYCDYRKLTDLPVGTNVPEGSTSQETTTAIELGNKAHLPVFQLLPPKVDGSSPPCKRSKRLLEKESNSDKNSEGYLYYKSVLVNVDNLKEQVTRNETARLKTEEKLTELRKELDDLREKSKRSADQVRALEKELRCCKSNLAVTAEKLSEQVASSDIYLSALMDIEERLVPILDTDEIKRLIKERQSVSGAPSINLVPLTKVEDITRVSNSDDVKYEEAAYKRELMEEDVKMEV